jgi:hypothetical protein
LGLLGGPACLFFGVIGLIPCVFFTREPAPGIFGLNLWLPEHQTEEGLEVPKTFSYLPVNSLLAFFGLDPWLLEHQTKEGSPVPKTISGPLKPIASHQSYNQRTTRYQ